MPALTTAGIAAVLVLLSAPLVRTIMVRAGVLDVPNDRSSHSEDTTRGGGLTVALGCVVGATLSSPLDGMARSGLLLAAVGMGVIGLLDDVRSVGVVPRLLGQVVVSASSVGLLVSSVHGPIVWQVGLSFAAFVWVIAYVNAFNFMDGINGISVVQVVVAGVVWWSVGVTRHAQSFAAAGLMVAAAGAAFAPFNVPKARMFLGDVGSYFLGAWLAATAVIGLRSGLPAEAVFAPLALYAADTFSTLVGRMRRGEPWSHPHREHVYQQHVQSGWTHGRTSLAVGLVIGGCGGLGALSLTGSVALRAIGDALIALLLALYLVSPRLRRWHGEAGSIAPSASS